ncbi:MAG: methylated-DNA--[protein]-cysteine S-methyltransferase [Phenylobacterium sp.]
MAHAYALFETALGEAAVVWGEAGIVGAQLPQRAHATTDLARRFPEAEAGEPPPYVAAIISGVQALMRGEAAQFSQEALDLTQVPEFNRRVYAVAMSIPAGQTLTYGEVAERLGDARLARAVGQALGQNPFPPIVPCHRVLAAGGRTGGFSGPGGVAAKLKLLEIEGALALDRLPLFGG